jgi:AcrR family transcriptional regulator
MTGEARTEEARPAEARGRLDRDGRREAIIDVATAVFLEVGYSAASMSMIAARLGGSKGTLYNYFKSKEELFEAYVGRHCAWKLETMDEVLSRNLDAPDTLTCLGRILLRVVLAGDGFRNFVLVVSESARAPEIGRAFYEVGPMRGAERLAAYVARAVAAGRLRPCDPLSAAHQFVGLCQNRLLKARLCNAAAEPTAAEIEAEVAAAVATFMAAFGPRVPI